MPESEFCAENLECIKTETADKDYDNATEFRIRNNADTEFVLVESVKTEQTEEICHSDYFIELNEDALKQEQNNEDEEQEIFYIENLDNSKTNYGRVTFIQIFPSMVNHESI